MDRAGARVPDADRPAAGGQGRGGGRRRDGRAQAQAQAVATQAGVVEAVGQQGVFPADRQDEVVDAAVHAAAAVVVGDQQRAVRAAQLQIAVQQAAGRGFHHHRHRLAGLAVEGIAMLLARRLDHASHRRFGGQDDRLRAADQRARRRGDRRREGGRCHRERQRRATGGQQHARQHQHNNPRTPHILSPVHLPAAGRGATPSSWPATCWWSPPRRPSSRTPRPIRSR